MDTTTISTEVCAKCDEEEPNTNNGFECDGCLCFYHYKCDGMLKKDVKARAASTRLQLYCEKCIADNPMKILSNNMKKLLQFIYKIDMVQQQQYETNKNIEEKLTKYSKTVDEMSDLMKSMKHDTMSHAMGASELHVNEHQYNTYASTLAGPHRSRRVLPTVIVKPKSNTQSQKSDDTFQEIVNNVANIDSVIRDTRNVRGGGILLSCENANATMKVKQMIEKQMGAKYDVELPPIRNPRVKISRVEAEFSKEEIVDSIKNKNNLPNGNIKIIKLLKRGKDGIFNDVIAEVDGETFDRLDRMKKVCIGWRIHDVNEHLYLKRCFKCCGFAHIAKECKNHTACFKCAGEHKSNECSSNSYRCISCTTANNKFNLNLQTDHHAWSRSCTVLQKRVEKLKKRIEYNAIE